MSAPEIVNLNEKLASFSSYWDPHIVGRYNGNEVRVVKVEGDFTWHSHPKTDEMFLVIKGKMGIEFRDCIRRFGVGEMIVVPKGTEHRPFAEEECHVLILDREGESNTGDTPSYRTRERLGAI